MTIIKVVFCAGIIIIAGLTGVALGVIDKMCAEEREYEMSEVRHD